LLRGRKISPYIRASGVAVGYGMNARVVRRKVSNPESKFGKKRNLGKKEEQSLK
jgi:hypothetical protein